MSITKEEFENSPEYPTDVLDVFSRDDVFDFLREHHNEAFTIKEILENIPCRMQFDNVRKAYWFKYENMVVVLHFLYMDTKVVKRKYQNGCAYYMFID